MGGINNLSVNAAFTCWRIANTADIEYMVGADHALHSHFIAGQRAGFIRTDDGHRSQRLDSGQLPDDGVAPGHALHAQRQCYGHDGR